MTEGVGVFWEGGVGDGVGLGVVLGAVCFARWVVVATGLAVETVLVFGGAATEPCCFTEDGGGAGEGSTWLAPDITCFIK